MVRRASAATRIAAHQLYRQGLSALQIAAEYGFSSRTVHRWLKETEPVLEPQAPDLSEGLCAQTDPELFHPLHGEDNSKAKAICRRCPIMEQCRDYAVDNLELSGIWGATSHRERHALAKKRRQS